MASPPTTPPAPQGLELWAVTAGLLQLIHLDRPTKPGHWGAQQDPRSCPGKRLLSRPTPSSHPCLVHSGGNLTLGYFSSHLPCLRFPHPFHYLIPALDATMMLRFLNASKKGQSKQWLPGRPSIFPDRHT